MNEKPKLLEEKNRIHSLFIILIHIIAGTFIISGFFYAGDYKFFYYALSRLGGMRIWDYTKENSDIGANTISQWIFTTGFFLGGTLLIILGIIILTKTKKSIIKWFSCILFPMGISMWLVGCPRDFEIEKIHIIGVIGFFSFFLIFFTITQFAKIGLRRIRGMNNIGWNIFYLCILIILGTIYLIGAIKDHKLEFKEPLWNILNATPQKFLVGWFLIGFWSMRLDFFDLSDEKIELRNLFILRRKRSA